jgi:hypothetical protein
MELNSSGAEVPKIGPAGTTRPKGPEMAYHLTQARSASVQVKAAAPQVDDRNWIWETLILSPTIGVTPASDQFRSHRIRAIS